MIHELHTQEDVQLCCFDPRLWIVGQWLIGVSHILSLSLAGPLCW